MIVKLSIKHVDSSRWHSRRHPTFFINWLHGLLGYMSKRRMSIYTRGLMTIFIFALYLHSVLAHLSISNSSSITMAAIASTTGTARGRTHGS